jgi:alcohol dehydrogenase (cytochrome c)
MYLTFGATTVAIDATTCRQIWAYTWPLQGHIISPSNRGVAIKDGKLVRGVADGHLIALDLASGSLLWSQQIASATNGQYLSMPPLISGDMVIYGPAGADYGAQNWIGAFKLENGDPLWRFYLVPNPGQPGAASWKNQGALKHGGGSLWTPLSLDAKAGILYVPVGNPAPDFYGAVRPGADLYTDSVLALELRTGKLLWYHQFVVHDEHDTDLSQVSPLFELKVDNADRQLMAVSGKDGLLRVVDRQTHDILYEVPMTTRENADVEPTVDGAHRCPGLLGGEEWNGPAFDPVSKQLFVNAVDWCGTFKKFPAPPSYTAEQHYYGGSVIPDPREQAKGWLTAFDAATGKVNWKYRAPTPLIAGIVATSGGVLFTGDLDGNFLAMNSATGALLYRFNTGGSVGGGTVSYEQNGKQYVAITSGAVSAFFGGNGPPAVVVFALP